MEKSVFAGCVIEIHCAACRSRMSVAVDEARNADNLICPHCGAGFKYNFRALDHVPTEVDHRIDGLRSHLRAKMVPRSR